MNITSPKSISSPVTSKNVRPKGVKALQAGPKTFEVVLLLFSTRY